MPASLPARTLATAVGVALAVGIAGDLLLRGVPWGVGFAVWIAAAASGAAWVGASTRGTPWWTEARWYLPAVFFAACLTWRDAEELSAWNVLGTAIALFLPTLRAGGVALITGAVGRYVLEPVRLGIGLAFGPLAVAASDVEWQALGAEGRTRRVSRIVVGILLALPVALVFGSLLVSADAVFERAVRRLFGWNFETIASHAVLIAFLTWIAAGYLFVLLGRDPVAALGPGPRGRRPRLGLTEIGIPLGVLAVLLTAFVAIQARYLFGGESLVQATAGMTYAEYARAGFFELIVVAALLLPLLLAADWLLDPERPASVRGFRGLAALLLVLTLPVIASALERMRLYVDAYGLTIDRAYATTVMAWVVVSLAWLGFTVLRGKRDRFAFGAFAAGLGVLAALNVANPERVIARVNLARAARGLELDAEHLLRLSGDALPLVLAELSARDVAVSCASVERLRNRWGDERLDGWRQWNVGRRAGLGAVNGMDAAWAGRCGGE